MIREGAISKITSMIEIGRQDGMQLMDQGLMKLFKAGTITGEEAFMKAFNKKTFEQFRETGVWKDEEDDEE